MPEALLALVMIVKNEAESIEKTLLSCKPHIDRWTIVDTGSTDGTMEIIQRVLEDIPGQLVEAPFIDFATTRNFALDQEYEAKFALMLSGGESLVDGSALRMFCYDNETDHLGAYYVPVKVGSSRYDSPRLTRVPATKWRYEGVTHEVLVCSEGFTPTKRADAWILHEDRGSKRERWVQDLQLLSQEWSHRETPRTAFYLAQTHECLGHHREALEWYAIRIKMEGWREEVFEAKIRSAKIRLNTVPHVGVIELLELYDSVPHRAEPLYEIGLHYYRQKMYAAALIFAKRASEIPYPDKDILFVTESIYRWQSFDLVACCAKNDRYLALSAAAMALKGNPEDVRLQKNVQLLERKD